MEVIGGHEDLEVSDREEQVWDSEGTAKSIKKRAARVAGFGDDDVGIDED